MAERQACDAIMGFQGDFRWLSNFWPAEVAVGDVIFPTVEHGFVASKLEPGKGMPWDNFMGAIRRADPKGQNLFSVFQPNSTCVNGDLQITYPDLLKYIAGLKTPGQAKRFGRFIPLRPDWEEGAKVEAMRDLTRQKYDIADLRDKLLATKARQIFELNTWGDRFWGMVPDETDGPDLNEIGDFHGMDTQTMTGRNVLGLLLEERRYQLQLECSRSMVKGRLSIEMPDGVDMADKVKDCLVHVFGEYSGEVIEAGRYISFTVTDPVPNGDIDCISHPRARSILTNLGCRYLWTFEGGAALPPGGVAYDPASLRKPTAFFHSGLDDDRLTVLTTPRTNITIREELAEAERIGREIRYDEMIAIGDASLVEKGYPEMLSLPVGRGLYRKVIEPVEKEADLLSGMEF